MKFGDTNHQNVKIPDWIWSSGPDLAPLSRNRVKKASNFIKESFKSKTTHLVYH